MVMTTLAQSVNNMQAAAGAILRLIARWPSPAEIYYRLDSLLDWSLIFEMESWLEIEVLILEVLARRFNYASTVHQRAKGLQAGKKLGSSSFLHVPRATLKRVC